LPRQKSTHVDDPRAVGIRLKEAREQAGLSQRQLSFSGCSPAYISRIEAGDRIPSLQLLRELGKRLGVSEDYLATGAEARGKTASLEAELALRFDDFELATDLYEQLLAESAPPDERAEALTGLGRIALRRGQLDEAVRLLEEALSTGPRNECELPALGESLGRAYAERGDLARALAIFERCVAYFEQKRDSVLSIRFACLLGATLLESGNASRAETLLTDALETGEVLADPPARALLYFSQCRARSAEGDVAGASRYGRLALATLEAADDARFTVQSRQILARAALAGGRPEVALAHYEAARSLLESSGSQLEQARFGAGEARALAGIGRKEDAAALAALVPPLLDGASEADAGSVYSLLAEVQIDLGDAARARELYEQAAELLEHTNASTELVNVYSQIAELYEGEGRREDAYEYMKKAVGMQQQVAATART
jgi:tetratricopeptide (TPR) repeat protein